MKRNGLKSVHSLFSFLCYAHVDQNGVKPPFKVVKPDKRHTILLLYSSFSVSLYFIIMIIITGWKASHKLKTCPSKKTRFWVLFCSQVTFKGKISPNRTLCTPIKETFISFNLPCQWTAKKISFTCNLKFFESVTSSSSSVFSHIGQQQRTK